MASGEEKKREKIFEDEINKEEFAFGRTEVFKAPGMIQTNLKAKRGAAKKWEEYYAVEYLNYILLYKTPAKDKTPKTKDEPSEHIKLDSEFSYKLVQKVDKRIIVTGLIPKSKKFTNTMAVGPEYDEWLLQFEKEEDLNKWLQKTRKRCKRLRKAKLSLQGVDVLALINDIQTRVPMTSPALSEGPKENREEDWINIIEDYWQYLRNSKRELSEITLFAEYFNPDNARYLSWFTSPGISENSLERELLAAEDIFRFILEIKIFSF